MVIPNFKNGVDAMQSMTILSPLGILGYGFPEDSFRRALEKNPNIIAADAGSTDAGPHKLGAGVGIVSERAVRRDLSLMVRAGLEREIPILIGSAGGSGARPHMQWTLRVLEQVAKDVGRPLRVGVIYSDIEKSWLHKQLDRGRVRSLGPVPPLTLQDINDSSNIVAQIGHEPYLAMLDEKVDLILGGRTYDPAVFAAPAIRQGFDPGLAYHLGKILECGALCAIPGSAKDCMLAYLDEDGFTLESGNSERKCTVSSVAAHTLYEKSHVYKLAGPGGVLDLSQTRFEQLDDKTVRVTGSRFVPDAQYRVKLEGAKPVGYRTFFLAGIRDPQAIRRIDEIVAYTDGEVRRSFADIPQEDFHIDYKIYGKNGVMGPIEPIQEIAGHELCVVCDVVAATQELASGICAYARSTMLHYHYDGRYSTAGNLAFPFAPSDVEFGRVYRFSVYHLLEIDDPVGLFRREIRTIG